MTVAPKLVRVGVQMNEVERRAATTATDVSEAPQLASLDAKLGEKSNFGGKVAPNRRSHRNELVYCSSGIIFARKMPVHSGIAASEALTFRSPNGP